LNHGYEICAKYNINSCYTKESKQKKEGGINNIPYCYDKKGRYSILRRR